MNPYEQLRTRINELLPDRRKLEFGCEVKNEVGILERVLWSDENTFKGYTKVKLDGTAVPIMAAELQAILGKPLTIEDVLRALNKVTSRYAITAKGALMVHNDGTGRWYYDLDAQCIFDLSKPLSARENEEACGAVLKLLTI